MPISSSSLASAAFFADERTDERESGIVSTGLNSPDRPATIDEHSSPLQLLAQCQQEAAQRTAGRQKLKDQYTDLLVQEAKRRDKLASDLVSTDLGDLLLSPDYLSENDSEDTHIVSLEIAQSLFRQLAIAYLRKEHQAIRAFYLNQLNSPAVKDRSEIISPICDRLIYSILPAIPDELRDFLSKEAIQDENYRQETGLAYLKVGQIYPAATGQITINSPEDFDKVYGDLLSVFSGIGLSKWEASQEKQQRVQTQLKQYECTDPALPHPIFFNSTIKTPFRLFLLQEYMRELLESTLTENPSNNNRINLLDYIRRLGGKSHSTKVLEDFYQDRLSSPSICPENLNQAPHDRDSSSSFPPTSQPFSQSKFPSEPPASGQAFLDKFRENMPKDLPLADIYKTICLIQEISRSEPDLAEILTMKLGTIVSEYNPIYSAANIPPGASRELTTLIAAIEHQLAQ